MVHIREFLASNPCALRHHPSQCAYRCCSVNISQSLVLLVFIRNSASQRKIRLCYQWTWKCKSCEERKE